MPARPRMTSPSTVQAQRPGLLVGSFRSREPFPVEKRRVRAAASLAVSQRLACDVARDRAALATDPDRGCCCPCALHRPPLFPLLRALLSPPPSSAAPQRAFPRNAARRRRPRCRCPPARPIHRRCRRAPSPFPPLPPPCPARHPVSGAVTLLVGVAFSWRSAIDVSAPIPSGRPPSSTPLPRDGGRQDERRHHDLGVRFFFVASFGVVAVPSPRSSPLRPSPMAAAAAHVDGWVGGWLGGVAACSLAG